MAWRTVCQNQISLLLITQRCGHTRGPDMKRFLAGAVIAVSLVPMGAFAQERVGDAALGGLSGAIVLGPVGAVAGVVIGYTAGPSMSRSWGLTRPAPPYRGGRPTPAPYASASLKQAGALKQAVAQSDSTVPSKPAFVTKRTWNSPPVQGFE
jgi:hypothetical protein